jgi:hypothetical protein
VEPRRRRRLGDPPDGLRKGPTPLERPHAGQHLEQDDTQGIDIGRGRQLEPLYLLGGHVDRRPADDAGIGDGGEAVGGSQAEGQAEVHDDGSRPAPGIRHEHDVGALEVAVQDARRVGRIEPGGDLGEDLQRFVRRQPPLRRDPVRERPPRQQLHGQEQDLVSDGRAVARRRDVGPQVMDAAHVRMRHLVGSVYFALETHDRARVRRDLGTDRLEGHVLVEGEVLGFVHLAHRALGDVPNDLVTIGDDSARGKDPRRVSPATRPRRGGVVRRSLRPRRSRCGPACDDPDPGPHGGFLDEAAGLVVRP